MSAGQIRGVQLITEIVNEQVAIRLVASVAVQVTVVVPISNVVPEAGAQNVITPVQLSEVAGTG